MIYESLKRVQSDDTHPFWSTHKESPICIARKPRTDKYKEFLSRNTIHIHVESAPFVDRITQYSPSPPPRSFTLRFIPDRFCRRPLDSPPRFFTPHLIPNRFGDFPVDIV